MLSAAVDTVAAEDVAAGVADVPLLVVAAEALAAVGSLDAVFPVVAADFMVVEGSGTDATGMGASDMGLG